MEIGELDRRISLEELQTQLDTSGEALRKWSPIATVWARVRPVRGGESFTASQRLSEATHQFRIRWRAGLTARHRVVYEGVPYSIVEILELGRREALDILATTSPAEVLDE